MILLIKNQIAFTLVSRSLWLFGASVKERHLIAKFHPGAPAELKETSYIFVGWQILRWERWHEDMFG